VRVPVYVGVRVAVNVRVGVAVGVGVGATQLGNRQAPPGTNIPPAPRQALSEMGALQAKPNWQQPSWAAAGMPPSRRIATTAQRPRRVRRMTGAVNLTLTPRGIASLPPQPVKAAASNGAWLRNAQEVRDDIMCVPFAPKSRSGTERKRSSAPYR